MWKARIFDFTLFTASLIIVYFSGHIFIETDTFIKSLIIFWLFSCLYYNLRIFDNSGQTSIDYGINFALSFGIFTGPLGLFIYEFFYHFTVYLYKVIKKKKVGGDFLDIFYNIRAFEVVLKRNEILHFSAFYFFIHHLLCPGSKWSYRIC